MVRSLFRTPLTKAILPFRVFRPFRGYPSSLLRITASIRLLRCNPSLSVVEPIQVPRLDSIVSSVAQFPHEAPP